MGCFFLFCAQIWTENVLQWPLLNTIYFQNGETKSFLQDGPEEGQIWLFGDEHCLLQALPGARVWFLALWVVYMDQWSNHITFHQYGIVTRYKKSRGLVWKQTKNFRCEFQPVVTSPLAETKFNSCSGRSHQNEPWNLLCLSRLVGSVIFMYVNPWTFSKISFCQSLAETSVEQKYRPEDYETFFQASFTNNLHYRWHYMGQQWERSLFSNFQLCGGPLAETGSRAERGHWRQNDTLKHLFRAYFTQFWRKFWNRGRWFWEVSHAPSP